MNKLFILALLAVLVIPTASAMENTTYYFDPPNPVASGCGDTVVRVMAHAPYDLNVAEFSINYSASCIEIVDVELNPAWTMAAWNGPTRTNCWEPGHDWISTWAIVDLEGPEAWICNITIRCKDPSCTYCKTNMNFTCGLDPVLCMFIAANTSGIVPHNATNGIFTCGEAPDAETFSKDLYEGWNLISLPLVPAAEDNSASAVLSGVSYDAVYQYSATLKQFEGIESTGAMNPGTGYFVHATADCTWSYSGTAYNSMDISLEQGLNMVGWLNCSRDVGDALSSLSGEYYYVARWDTTTEKFEVHNPAAPFNDFTTMDRGTGYFISAKQDDCTLSGSC